MTRKEALARLLGKVEAGNPAARDIAGAFGAFGPPQEGISWAVYNAMQGSLDAAKALHEEVLPGWTMDQMNEWHANGESAGWHVCLLKYSEPQLRARAGEFDMSPARAWLIAVIKALIAQEPEA